MPKTKAPVVLLILDLLSPGGVHSHTDHLYGIVAEAKKAGVKEVYVHAFLDGRDTPPRSAKPSIGRMQELLDSIDGASFATISGQEPDGTFVGFTE